MRTQTLTIRQAVNKLNEGNDDGGFWLPDIQRPFVWSKEQICRLFDSILREYPISTLLIWKTKMKEIKHRRFIERIDDSKNVNLSELFIPCNDKIKNLVLDGQQRLQSLYIGLRGSYEGKELFLDMKSGEQVAPDDIKYRFSFLFPNDASFPLVRFSEIVYSNKLFPDIVANIEKQSDKPLSQEERESISRLVARIQKVFSSDTGIIYQELDGVDLPELYRPDEVVEIFIRTNSGGTKLSKSDLLFSLLVSEWDEAIKSMEDVLKEINDGDRFDFDRDFILKVCLTLLDKKASYREAKFREPGVRERIQENWNKISQAIEKVVDYLSSKTFLRCAETLPSDQALIPLVNFCYRFPTQWKSIDDKQAVDYLIRILLTGALSKSHADTIIDRMVDDIRKNGTFDKERMFDAVRADGLSLTITEDHLWEMGYGSSQIHLLFNLWYDFNYRPAFSGNKPQIDHIFPQSELKKIKAKNPETGAMNLTKYRKPARDQLANCMLLTAVENGAGGKWDKLPEEWFADKDEKYFELHLIPRDKELWKLHNFEAFIEARKKLIKEKFEFLLVPE